MSKNIVEKQWKTIKSSRAGIVIRYGVAIREDGSGYIRAYAEEEKTGKKIVTYRRRNIRNKTAVEGKTKALIAAIENELKQLGELKKGNEESRKKAPVSSADNVYLQALKQVNVVPDWGESTLNMAKQLAKNRFIPYLLELGDIKCIDDVILDIFREKCLAQIAESGNSKKSDKQRVKTAEHEIARFIKLYEEMRRLDPMLPPITGTRSGYSRNYQIEQFRELPDTVRRQFIALLEEQCCHYPALVRAAVLMLDAGLRTAEAAAVRTEDFEFYKDIALLPVLVQEKDGKRNPVLKREASYRIVALSSWGSELVRMCNEQIEEPQDPEATCIRARELSSKVVEWLTKSGGKELIEKVKQLQKMFPERDIYENISTDLAAYILRRDCASRWRNSCGMLPAEIDALLGHKRWEKKAEKTDTKLKENLYTLAMKMDRYIASETGKSTNPEITPLPLKRGEKCDPIEYLRVRVENREDKPMRVSVSCKAVEPGQSVMIEASRRDEGLRTQSEKQSLVGKMAF